MNLTINMSDLEIKELLKKTMKPEYAEEMAQCILSNTMSDELVLQMFIKVAMQIPIKCKYRVGERLLCEMYALGSWSFDKDVMYQNKMLDSSNNTMLVRILEVVSHKPFPYKVQYSYINKNNGKLETSESWIKEDHFAGYPILIGDTA